MIQKPTRMNETQKLFWETVIKITANAGLKIRKEKFQKLHVQAEKKPKKPKNDMKNCISDEIFVALDRNLMIQPVEIILYVSLTR